MKIGDIIINPWVSKEYDGKLNPMYATIYIGDNRSVDYKGRVHRWAEKVYKEGNEREWKVVGHCNPLGWMYEQIIKSIDPLKTDCPVCSEAQREDEAASDMRDYCERYEPTYNPEDGSM